MRFVITSRANANLEEVWANFNENLFRALAPPFPPVRLLRFDGCCADDEVHLQLDFLIFKQLWISKITEQATGVHEIYFTDEGIRLPFFLRRWRHKHLLQALPDGGTRIIDDVTFETPAKIFDWLLLPFLYLQFLYRRPAYKRFFNKIKKRG